MCVLDEGDGYQECHEVRAWAWGCRRASAIEAGEGNKDERRGRRVNNGHRRKADQLAMLKIDG